MVLNHGNATSGRSRGASSIRGEGERPGGPGKPQPSSAVKLGLIWEHPSCTWGHPFRLKPTPLQTVKLYIQNLVKVQISMPSIAYVWQSIEFVCASRSKVDRRWQSAASDGRQAPSWLMSEYMIVVPVCSFTRAVNSVFQLQFQVRTGSTASHTWFQFDHLHRSSRHPLLRGPVDLCSTSPRSRLRLSHCAPSRQPQEPKQA